MSIYISADYWKAFAAQAAKEAERLAREAEELIARVESSCRESEEEKARIQAAKQALSNGERRVFSIDFKGGYFKG